MNLSITDLSPIPLPAAGGPWVLLWSHSQNAMHIESFAEMLASNRTAYTNNRSMDYVPLFAGQQEDCHAISSAVRNTMIRRQERAGMATWGQELG